MQQTEAMRRLGLTIAAALAIVGALASRAVAAPDLAAYVNPFNGTRAGAPNFGTGVGLNPGTRDRIGAELTATTRAGIGRFAYPATHMSSVLINATGSRTGDSGGSVHVDRAGREVTGSASSGGFCFEPNKYKIYFV